MRRALPFPLLLVSALGTPGFAEAAQKADPESELLMLERGEHPEIHLGQSNWRVAVFTFEDPDATGLGDLLAGLVARRILLGSSVEGLGVIQYAGNLAPSSELDHLSYFDKVDRLAAAQYVSIAIWGIIHRSQDGLQIETFAQLSKDRWALSWTQQVRSAPKATGHAPPKLAPACGELRAELRPQRIAIQQFVLPDAAVSRLRHEGGRLDEIRASPSPDASVLGVLSKGQVYRVLRSTRFEQIRDRFVRIRVGPARPDERNLEGWIPIGLECGSGCALLNQAGEFGGELLKTLQSRGRPPQVTEGLGTEALAISEQLAALRALGDDRAELERGLTIVAHWDGPERVSGLDPVTHIDRGSGPPPGGAAFANARALLRVALARRNPQDGKEGIAPQKLAEIAFDLAEAVQNDPLNTDALRNLVVLFKCAGDEARAQAAEALLQRIGSPPSP